MSRPAHILIYGRESSLLDTRRWVLERAGFNVHTTTKSADAEEILTAQNPQLLILCHTVEGGDASDLLAIAKAIGPKIKTLVLTANLRLRPVIKDEHILSVFEGPRAMIATVDELLSR